MSPKWAIAFLTPILFNDWSNDHRISNLLFLRPQHIVSLLKCCDVADRMSKRFGPGAELVFDQALQVLDPPDELLPTLSKIEFGNDAVPDGLWRGPFETWPFPTRLHVQASHLYWSRDSVGHVRGFRTGNVSWGDLMEFRLMTARRTAVAGVFRRLSEREPERALAVVEHGICFPRFSPWAEVLPVDLPPSAMDVLLSHGDIDVRQRAISLLGKTGARRGA